MNTGLANTGFSGNLFKLAQEIDPRNFRWKIADITFYMTENLSSQDEGNLK
jgi:hypothetical protein